MNVARPTNVTESTASLEQDKSPDSVRAVDRALEVLLAFKGNDGALSVAELLNRLDLRRATLYRLLHTLAQKGFVVSSGDPLRFRLGPSVAELAHSWNASTRLSEAAQPAMRRIWEATGETVALFVPEGMMRICIAELPSAQALSFKRGVGYRERLVLGATGLPILAHIGGSLDLAAYAAGLDVDLDERRVQLDLVRRRGYAVSRGELIEGAVAIAAPVFDAHDRVVGSLGIFGPSVRLSDAAVSDCGSLLISEAAAVSTGLGKSAP